MSITTINPANGEILREYQEYSPKETENIMRNSHSAFLDWQKSKMEQRAEFFTRAASILRKKKNEYARLMALEMGKPLRQGISEVEKCAWACDYYVTNAAEHLEDQVIYTDMKKSYVTFQPIGTILAIMPWNFPFWQVFRFAVPTLMAGNSGVLKHSSNTMGCAIEIENIFREAGFPDGLFSTLIIKSDAVNSVIDNRLIAAVTLTGSTPVGRKVAERAGSLIKKTVLELGGSDPYIILDDADLESAAETCVNARIINSGQSCIAAKRFIAVDKIYDDFTGIFVEKMSSKRMGDPLDERFDLGPQARLDLQQDLQRQVDASVKAGAKLLLGGDIPAGKGFYYPPTVLANVSKGMVAYEEEIFGPVASIIRARDEADAVRIANDTSFGLGAAIFTSDIQKGEKLAKEQIQAGSCFVNAAVHSDPRLPFGGIKESGYGRELSLFGIREFVNIKTVSVS